jgi:ParB family chromosome partitioning protein
MQKQFTTTGLMKGIIEEVDVHKIYISSYLFRDSFFTQVDNNLDELAFSIRQNGLLNPIIVRIVDTGYQIITGNRRYLALRKLGLRKILCQVVEVDDREAFEIYLVDNLQRKSLDPLEEGKAFKAYVYDYGWGGLSDLSAKISKSVPYISKRISLLELPQEIANELKNSNLSTSAAEELVFIKNKDKQIQIANFILKKKLSVAKTRKLIKEKKYSNASFDPTDNYIDNSNRDTLEEIDFKAQRAFDKTISSLKVTLSKIGSIVEDMEDNWIVYEILMQHKNMLHNQIDILIKEKKKLY